VDSELPGEGAPFGPLKLVTKTALADLAQEVRLVGELTALGDTRLLNGELKRSVKEGAVALPQKAL